MAERKIAESNLKKVEKNVEFKSFRKKNPAAKNPRKKILEPEIPRKKSWEPTIPRKKFLSQKLSVKKFCVQKFRLLELGSRIPRILTFPVVKTPVNCSSFETSR